MRQVSGRRGGDIVRLRKNLFEFVFDYFNVIFMFIISALTLYPVLYVAFASLSDASELFRFNGFLFKPLGFSIDAYSAVLKDKNILFGYRNTIFIVVVGVAINILMTSLGAYFLSRKNVLWKYSIMMFILITMYINGGLIPSYLNIRALGMNNSYLALLIPTAISTFNLIILRTAFLSIPDSMEESARIDGANHLTILFRIVLPLSKATIAVLVLYYGVAHWNSWFNALIFIQDRSKYPLQLVLRSILLENQTGGLESPSGGNEQFLLFETIKYAVIIVATLPILLLYPFLQKYFVKGVMIGAVKG